MSKNPIAGYVSPVADFTRQERLYRWLFLACVAVLPMSGTVALRNGLLLSLVALLLLDSVQHRAHWRQRLGEIPWPLALWLSFLLLFPFWAQYPDEAWANLRSQWFESMVAWAVGFGAIWVMGKRCPSLVALAWASSFSLMVHLGMVALACIGVFGGELPESVSFTQAAVQIKAFCLSASQNFAWRGIPWGFHGVEPMHGNLGYTGCQAIVLASVAALHAWKRQDSRGIRIPLVIVVLCFVSLLIASSRGGIFYALLWMFFAAVVYRVKLASPSFHVDNASIEQSHDESKSRYWFLAISVAAIAILAVLTTQLVARDPRWRTMADKVALGWQQPDPIKTLCEGLSPEQEEEIRLKYQDREKAYVDQLIAGLTTQDAARVMLMRAGISLVVENPKGLDGGRNSYQKLIEAKCGHLPVLGFSHLHQSWMDIALALGWIGALLLAYLFLSFAITAWVGLRSTAWEWAFALFLMATFWFARGFVDSLYREHYLQMQAILISYLWMALRKNSLSSGQ